LCRCGRRHAGILTANGREFTRIICVDSRLLLAGSCSIPFSFLCHTQMKLGGRGPIQTQALPNFFPHGPTVGKSEPRFFSCGCLARITKLHGVIVQRFKLVAKRSEKRCDGQNQFQQSQKVVNFREASVRFHQKRLEIFLGALLTKETNQIRIGMGTDALFALRRAKIAFRLFHPFSGDGFHKGLFPCPKRLR